MGYANNFDILVRKVHVEGRKGWPDLELIFPITGETVRVEMKNPNGRGRLEKLQKAEHKKIRKRNAVVYVCQDFEHFKQIVHKHLVRI